MDWTLSKLKPSVLQKAFLVNERKSFNASYNGYIGLKLEPAFKMLKVSGKAVSTTWYTWEFPEMLWEITNEGPYLPKQVFNVDKTGLHWKRMPDQSYIRKEEKLMSGYKGAKDMLTVVCGNASDNMKLKSLSVYLPYNQRTLKNIAKASFPIVWKGIPKAWNS